MARERDYWGKTEREWAESLVRESDRDFVFLVEVAHWAADQFKCSPSEVIGVVERASSRLLTEGCSVGFVDAESGQLSALDGLSGEPSVQGKRIAELWSTDPERYRFLAFARAGT